MVTCLLLGCARTPCSHIVCRFYPAMRFDLGVKSCRTTGQDQIINVVIRIIGQFGVGCKGLCAHAASAWFFGGRFSEEFLTVFEC